MNETDRGIIEAQIAAGIATPAGAMDFAGNFICNLPGGDYRSMIERHDWFEQPVVQADEADGVYPASERARSVTWRTFFGDVDEATRRSGVDLDELERLRQARKHRESDQDGSTALSYILAALPIYLELRVMGYSHHDLQR